MKLSKGFYEEYIRPLIAEYFGQLIFTFLHCSTGFNNKLGTALPQGVSDGFTVAILVVIIGHISGAHVNFAVTTAVFLGGGIVWKKVPFYLASQLLGSLTGAGLAYVVLPFFWQFFVLLNEKVANGKATGAFALGVDVTVGRGLLMEVITSSLLTLTVLLAAVELEASMAGIAIGFSILIDILASYHVTGGCMNPSLSFGPAVVSGQWEHYWIYWVAPLLGALVSAALFRVFLGGRSARFLFNKTTNEQASGENGV